MKTIGYSDKCDGRNQIYIYTQNGQIPKYESLFNQSKNERIIAGFKNIEHLGNCNIYYIKGNKTRLIAERGF
jgi:hypothetical protein